VYSDGIDQEFEVLRTKAILYHPDIMILGYGICDITSSKAPAIFLESLSLWIFLRTVMILLRIGYGIDRRFRFTDRIKERVPNNYGIINMEIWGYCTDQEFVVFKEKALKYSPDIVCLVLFLDDLYTTNLFSVNGGIH